MTFLPASLRPARPTPAAFLPPRAALACAALAAAGVARAQSSLPDEGTTSRFVVGAGAAHVPRYEGADSQRTRALPLISWRSGRFFAGALGGIGYDVSTVPGLSFGPVLSYRFGRDEDWSPRLRGLGDVDAGADVGAFARWNLRPFFAHANLRRGIGGGPAGTQARLGAGYMLQAAPADRVIFDLSVDWADREVMQAFFGVDATQSRRSGRARHDVGSGVRRYGASVAWTHTYTPRWFSTVGASLMTLGSGAADSPIVDRRTSPAVSLAVGYRF